MSSNSKQKSHSRPLMLKDFLLLEESGSFRRASVAPATKIRKSRSMSAAIAALQKLLTSLKSRSSKKKMSPSPSPSPVTVKDILRWRSFRDLIDGLGEEEKSQPLDRLYESRNERCRFEGPEMGKRNVGGEDPMMAGTGSMLCSSNDIVGPTDKSDGISTDDEEQYSPISVLHSPFRDEDNDSVSSLDQALANVERTTQRLMESIKWLEGLAGANSDDDEVEFLEEPNNVKTKNYCFKDDTSQARANIGSIKEPYVTGEIEECLREMETEMLWSTRFEEQTNQLGSELGLDVLNALLDDIVFDLIGRS